MPLAHYRTLPLCPLQIEAAARIAALGVPVYIVQAGGAKRVRVSSAAMLSPLHVVVHVHAHLLSRSGVPRHAVAPLILCWNGLAKSKMT